MKPLGLLPGESRQQVAGRTFVGIGAIGMIGSLSISLVAMHAAMALGVFGCLLLRPAIFRIPGFWFGVAFSLWQVAGILSRSYFDGQVLFHSRRGTLTTWLAIYVFVVALSEQRYRFWALVAASVTMGASVVVSVLQFFIGHGGARPFRISSSGWKHYSSSGFMPLHLTQGFILTHLGLMFLVAREQTGLPKWLAYGARVMAFAGVLLANSRAGILGMVSGVSAWFGAGQFTVSGTFRLRRILWVGGFALALLTAVAGWTWLVSASKIQALVAGQDGRLIHWRVATVMIGDHPWFGVGSEREFAVENNRILPILFPDGSQNQWLNAPDAHNIILGMASEQGIPAVFLYLLFMAVVLRHLYRRRIQNPTGWRIGCGAMAAMAVGGQFEFYAGHTATSYAFFMTLSLAIALDRSFLEERGIIQPVAQT